MESQELGEEDKAMVRNHPLYRKLWPLYKPSQKKVSFWCFFIICFLEIRLRLLRLNTIVFQIQAKSHHWRPILILRNGSCSYSEGGSSTMNGSQVVWNRLYIISRVSIWFGDLLHRSKTSEDEDGKDVDVLRRPDDGGAWPTAHWCIKAN